MNLFDDSFSDYRWQGDSSLPLHNVGYNTRLQQLKDEFSQLNRSEDVRVRSTRRLHSWMNRKQHWSDGRSFRPTDMASARSEPSNSVTRNWRSRPTD